jgi:hypothetical protein
MKNINNRKIISVNEDMLNSALTLFLLDSPIYAGSWSKSINSTVVASILKTTLSTLETRIL